MKLLVALLVMVQGVLHVFPAQQQQLLQAEWEQWRAEHGKRYLSAADEATKRQTWSKNYDHIQKHNNRGNAAMKLSLNQFADMVGCI